MTTSRRVAAIAGFALVLAACSSGGDSDEGAADPPDPTPTEAVEAAPADDGSSASTGAAPQALQFQAELIGGGDLDLAASFDGKPTVLWFWAPWCGVCNREASSVEQVAQQYGEQVDFVGVAWSGSEEQFQGFVDDHGLTFPQISDDPGLVYERFGVAFQPALVVVQPDGSLEQLSGTLDSGRVEEIIAQAA